MHPQMIKCFMALLNGFLKNQGHLLHSEKIIIGDLKKNNI